MPAPKNELLGFTTPVLQQDGQMLLSLRIQDGLVTFQGRRKLMLELGRAIVIAAGEEPPRLICHSRFLKDPIPWRQPKFERALRRWQAGGGTQLAVCQRAGLSYHQFRRWLFNHRKRARGEKPRVV